MTKVKWISTLLMFSLMSASNQEAKPQPEGDQVYPTAAGVKAPTLLHAAPALVPGELWALRRVTALLVVVGANGLPASIKVENNKASPLDESAMQQCGGQSLRLGALRASQWPRD